MINDNKELSKNAQSIQNELTKRNINFKIIEFSQSTRTANDAAHAIGCSVGQIVKSLIFRIKNSNKPVLILVSGSNRVNEKNIETSIGETIEKADADFTHEVTGFAIGGIPPLGHKHAIETYIDKDLLQFEELWAAAGTPNAVFNLKSKDLESITQGKVITVT